MNACELITLLKEIEKVEGTLLELINLKKRVSPEYVENYWGGDGYYRFPLRWSEPGWDAESRLKAKVEAAEYKKKSEKVDPCLHWFVSKYCGMVIKLCEKQLTELKCRKV